MLLNIRRFLPHLHPLARYLELRLIFLRFFDGLHELQVWDECLRPARAVEGLADFEGKDFEQVRRTLVLLAQRLKEHAWLTSVLAKQPEIGQAPVLILRGESRVVSTKARCRLVFHIRWRELVGCCFREDHASCR